MQRYAIHDGVYNETYYPGGVDPDGPPDLTDWLCPACQEQGYDHKLMHTRCGFFCAECRVWFDDDGELARAYAALLQRKEEKIAGLESARDETETTLRLLEFRMAEARRLAA